MTPPTVTKFPERLHNTLSLCTWTSAYCVPSLLSIRKFWSSGASGWERTFLRTRDVKSRVNASCHNIIHFHFDCTSSSICRGVFLPIPLSSNEIRWACSLKGRSYNYCGDPATKWRLFTFQSESKSDRVSNCCPWSLARLKVCTFDALVQGCEASSLLTGSTASERLKDKM